MNRIKELFTAENIKKGLKWFFFSYIWLAILMFIIDIVSKQLIMANLTPNLPKMDEIKIIPDFLHIGYVQNDGMAFGIDTGNKIANIVLFVSVSVIGSILIAFFMIKGWKTNNKVVRASLMLMLAGTIGNLVDRAFYVAEDGTHFVVDFIHFYFGKSDFPLFNVADSCLVVGIIILLISILVTDIKENKRKQAEVVTAKETVNETSIQKDNEVKETNNESVPETKTTEIKDEINDERK